MRILQVLHDFLPQHVAGVEVYTDLLARRLAQEHDVALLFSEVVPEVANYTLRRGRRGRVLLYELVNNHQLRRFEETWRNRAIDRRVHEVLDEFAPDVVHVQHLLNLSVGVVEAAQARRIPVVMTLHDHWIECANGGQRFHAELGRCDELDVSRCADCTAHMGAIGLGVRGALRRRRATRQSDRSLSLLDVPRREQAGGTRFVYEDRYAVAPGQTRPTLVTHPSSRADFAVEVERGGRFAALVAMHPDTHEREGGAVRFVARINGAVRIDVTLDAKRSEADRLPQHVDAPLEAGRNRIELETVAVPAHDNRYTTAGWVDPRVFGHAAAPTPARSGLRSALARAGRIAARRSRRAQQQRIEQRWQAMRALAERVDLFISPSRYLRDELVGFGLPAERVVHCDYGFETSAFRRREDLPERARHFAFIGSLVQHKGAHVLVEAFAGMPEDARLDLYGSLDYDPAYCERLRNAARHPGIRLCGPLAPERVPTVQQAIDCQVVPSIWRENSPLTIHEAFLSGVPVVASRLGGSVELLASGGGLLYDADSADALRAALMRLYEEAGLGRRLAAMAPEVKPMARQAHEVLAFYARAQARPRAPRP